MKKNKSTETNRAGGRGFQLGGGGQNIIKKGI